MTKNVDIDKYGYSGYGIRFDRSGSFSFPGGRFGQNVLILGSSAHIDNKKKDTLVKHIRQMYSINSTVKKKEILFESALKWSKWLHIC